MGLLLLHGTPGGMTLLLKQKLSAGRRLKKSQINLRFSFGSYGGRTLRVLIPPRIYQRIKKDPLGHF